MVVRAVEDTRAMIESILITEIIYHFQLLLLLEQVVLASAITDPGFEIAVGPWANLCYVKIKCCQMF